MTTKIELTPEQEKAYDRFIKARYKAGVGKYRNSVKSWIPPRDYSETVDIAGMNHPLFVVNDEYIEYKTAFAEWLKVEPEFREKERMRSSRGDYGVSDSWEYKSSGVKELK